MPLRPNHTYVIAEVGSNWVPSLDRAVEHIEAAAEAGADAAKFQLFRLEDVAKTPDESERHLELPPDWVPTLANACWSKNIDFLCTPFAPWSVKALEPHVWAFKIGSFEVARQDIWDAVRATGKPVIASCGRGNPPFGLLLYCVSKYPCQPADISLPEFGHFDGFSDHTLNTLIPALAVARGAFIIEKHFTLTREHHTPDTPHSLEPAEFAEMVRHIRLAEEVCKPKPLIRIEYPKRRE